MDKVYSYLRAISQVKQPNLRQRSVLIMHPVSEECVRRDWETYLAIANGYGFKEIEVNLVGKLSDPITKFLITKSGIKEEGEY